MVSFLPALFIASNPNKGKGGYYLHFRVSETEAQGGQDDLATVITQLAHEWQLKSRPASSYHDPHSEGVDHAAGTGLELVLFLNPTYSSHKPVT